MEVASIGLAGELIGVKPAEDVVATCASLMGVKPDVAGSRTVGEGLSDFWITFVVLAV